MSAMPLTADDLAATARAAELAAKARAYYDAEDDFFATLNFKPHVPAATPTETASTNSEYSSDAESEEINEQKIAPPAAVAEAPAVKTWREVLAPRLWSIATLAGIYACAPFVVGSWAAVVGASRLFFGGRAARVPWNGKTALVTGGKMTKSFVICKQLKAQGCRVVLLETSKYWMVASRFSNCVDRFATVPVPEKDPDAFLEAVRALAVEEKADLFVPVTSPVASQYEAHVASVLPAGCRSWSLDPDEVEALDDKMQFCASAAALGLSTPEAHRIGSDDEVRAFNAKLLAGAAALEAAFASVAAKAPGEAAPGENSKRRYIFKNLQYDSMHRLDLFTLPCAPAKLDAYLAKLKADGVTIDDANPWTAQRFVVGDEYSTCAVVADGRLLAFSDNRASLSCFNYLPARDPQLRAWVEAFCKARRLSGIVCIDFIVDDATGVPFAIECNPRFSSNIAAFYNNPEFGAALVAPDEVAATVEPRADVVETYWLFSEAWAALTKPGAKLSRAAALLSAVLFKKDAYFDVSDPLPFLGALFVHLPTLLARNVRTGNKWAKIDPCIGKMTEENGD